MSAKPTTFADGPPNEARVSAVVVGAGVVGCAVAHALAERGLETVVLERAGRCGEGTSSRNSGVIHAGLYYPPGSLKASLCVRGNALLYEWCRARGVPHQRTGKWIVGSAAEEEELAALHDNALRAGATGLSRVTAAQLAGELPGVAAEIGLFSAETGLVDPAALCRSLQAAAEERGARFVFHARVLGIARAGAGYRLETSRGPIDAELLVNSAGLYADEVARLVGLDGPPIHPCRGDYFALAGAARVPRRIVYPVRKRGSPGLGIHLTPALDGSLRLGPDAWYVPSKEELGPPPDLEARRLAFFEAARSYLPSLRLDQLRYDSCGLRPKLRAPGEPEERDFVITQELPGFMSLLGIESPGLTAALAIAEHVSRLLTR